MLDCFAARSPRTDKTSAFPRHDLPEFCQTSPQNSEGAGNAGRPMHPQPRVRVKKARELVTTVTPESPGIPRAMVLTVSFVLSPVTGLSCHRRLRIIIRQA